MPTQNDSKHYALDQSPFYKLRNRKKLTNLLRITQQDLRMLAKNAGSLYREFPVEKKGGGTRRVENPARQLKLVQATIARWLNRIRPPDYLFCPVKGRCYVGNAAHHRGQRVVRCLDVRKYFPSTSYKRVYWFFHKVMRCEKDIAAILTEISTYNGHLPTGSPLSPILAYYAHYDVWQNVAAICNENGYRLSVYIDDVTISGQAVSASVVWQIKRAIHRSGLRYHKEKSFFNGVAEITGVIIKGEQILVPNRQLKKIVTVKKQMKATKAVADVKKLEGKLGGLQGQMRQLRAFRT